MSTRRKGHGGPLSALLSGAGHLIADVASGGAHIPGQVMGSMPTTSGNGGHIGHHTVPKPAKPKPKPKPTGTGGFGALYSAGAAPIAARPAAAATTARTPTTTRTPVRASGPAGGGGGGARGTAGSGPGAGHTHGSGKAAPAKAAVTVPQPDQINQMIQGALQQNQRLTDFYDQQTAAQQQQTVADAQRLAAAAGQLGSYTPLAQYSGDPLTAQQANEYTALADAAAKAVHSNTLGATQAQIANAGNAVQQLLASNRSSAGRANIEYAQRTRANEPQMRADQAAADAKQQLDIAQQQYLRDKLSLDGQKAVDSSTRWQAELNQRGQIAGMNYQQKGQLAKMDAALKVQLAGLTLDAGQRKEVNSWVQHNLYGSSTETIKAPDGSSQSSKKPQKLNIPYDKIITDMTAQGFDPAIAIRVALGHSPKSAKSAGAATVFIQMTQAGMSKRQAIRQLASIFDAKTVKFIQRNSQAVLDSKAATHVVGAP